MFKKIISLTFLALVTLFAGEIALRFIPSTVQYPLRIQFSNEDGIGVIHPKNISVNNLSACFNSVRYSTNKWGMHDRNRSLEKTPGVMRVAMLGDSMLDAEQVNDEEVINRLLEDKFEGKAEFLNFGMNAIGPMQYSLLYENKVNKFKPDIVLVMFYTENDIANSSVSLETTIFNGEPFLTYRDENGNPYSLIKFDAKKKIKQFLQRNSAIYRLARLVFSEMKAKRGASEATSVIEDTVIEDTIATTTSEIPLAKLRQGRGANIRNEVFIVPPDNEWETAWKSTEIELKRLKEAVEKGGGRLFISVVPSVMEFDPRTKETINDAVFQKIASGRLIDIDYPRNRITDILERNGMDYFDLFQGMKVYAEQNNIGFPYFSFDCNSHWSKLGHSVAAEFLAPALETFIKQEFENKE